MILRTAHGAFHAASSNATSTWVTDIVPPSRMGEGLGMYGLSMAVSTAVAPALGLAVMNHWMDTAWGFRPLFGLAAVAAIIAVLTGISIKQRNYKLSAKPLKLSELFEPMSLPASITQFFYMMAYGVIEVYVAIYAATHHLPGGGIYFIFIAVAPERRGAASSTFFVAFDFGIALGGFLAGVLVKLCGYDIMFLLMALSCAISWGYYYLFGRNHASSFNPQNRLKQAEAAALHSMATEKGTLPLVITISREYGKATEVIADAVKNRE